jgi:hypothetical protein
MGNVIVAAIPIEPPDGERCWAFYVINDDAEPIERVLVESVSTEWGDAASSEVIGILYGGIAPGAYLEVHRETDTELRTGLSLAVTVGGIAREVYAAFGRLYAPSHHRLAPIPILGKDGLLAERG